MPHICFVIYTLLTDNPMTTSCVNNVLLSNNLYYNIRNLYYRIINLN